MAYVDYEYYRGDFGGAAIPEEMFPRCVRLAEKYVDHYTFKRILDPERVEGLKDCVCEMAEVVYTLCFKEAGVVKKSENIDGYAVSYVTEQIDGESVEVILHEKLYAICSLHLMNTGVMYRGLNAD